MFFVHVLLFLAAIAVVWMLSGVLIGAVERVAERFNQPGFALAFFLLGFLTSISEISVATNAAIEDVPQVSAGNLVGGVLVIFLFIVPLLAYAGGGIPIAQALGKRALQLTLFVSLLPTLFILDGRLTRPEGMVMILLYVATLYTLEKREPTEETLGDLKRGLMHDRRATITDLLKIVGGAVCIFLAGNLLVDESIILSQQLRIPPAFFGLILLSIGTNVPEITIAIRCITRKSKDVAFGDYLGSAAANTPIMGALILLDGNFSVERSEFLIAFPFLVIGLLVFYRFARSGNELTRREGAWLLGLYAAFLACQFFNLPALMFKASAGWF